MKKPKQDEMPVEQQRDLIKQAMEKIKGNPKEVRMPKPEDPEERLKAQGQVETKE